jgi:hypothetical protein
MPPRRAFAAAAVTVAFLSARTLDAAPFTLAFEPATAPLAGGLDGIWSAAPTIDRNLEPNATSRFFLNVTAWSGVGVPLLGWAPPPGAAAASPLRQRTSAVRLLGGWGPATPPGPPGSVSWPDVVFRDATGALQWRLPALFERLDGLVLGARNALVVVLDNVPYALARGGGAVSRYGQVLGPADDAEYGAFVAALVAALVARYGADEAACWQWRIGTEPNTRPGHWNDTVAAYISMYAAAAQAVRAILPAAQIGPGNFCPFAPGVGCDGTAETIVFPIIDGLVAQGSPVDFLSSSHYGAFKRTPGGDAQAGYDPVWGARNALDLVALRQRHPAALSGAPLSFMEFGCLANGPAGGIDNEPGAFGAAWRVATTAAAGAYSVAEFFDWGAAAPDFALADNSVAGAPAAGSNPDLDHLVYTSATLLRAFAYTARNATGTSALVARAGVASCYPELEVSPGVCVVPRASAAPGAVQVAGLAAVAGAAAATSILPPLAAGQLGPAAAGTVVIIATAFSVDRNATETAELALEFVCPQEWGTGACSGDAGGAPPALAVILDASTCLYDVALAQALRNGTDAPGNGGLPDGLSRMVTAAGLASMRDNAAWWMALQAASLRPRAAAGAGVALACAAGHCSASATLAPPAVLALWVGPQSR